MGNFGEYLRSLRKRKGLTLKNVEEAGVASNAYLSLLERGIKKSPHPDILKGLAAMYDVPVKDLMIEAGYLPRESEEGPSPAAIDSAFNHLINDPRIAHGTRRKNPKLNLEEKRFFVEMLQKLTGQKLI